MAVRRPTLDQLRSVAEGLGMRMGDEELKSYDALMQTRPDYANRISYVVAPNGTVAYFYQSLNPFKHVEKMLAAVKDLPQNRDKK